MRTFAIGFALCLVLVACHGSGTSIPPGSTRGAGSPNAQTRSARSIQTYAATVKADSPLIYYRMNETSGTMALDNSGHNYDGAYGSGVSLGTGSVMAGDAAPSFPGGTSSSATVLSSPANSAFAVTGAISVEFWVSVPATVASNATLFSQSRQSSSAPYPASVVINAGSSPSFTMKVYTSAGKFVTTAAAVPGASNHVVMTWDGTTLTGYVNGVASSGVTTTGTIANYASPYAGLAVGGTLDTNNAFGGAIGEFALYASALSAARVTAHYNAGIAAAPTPPPLGPYASVILTDGPVAYYPLNETTGFAAFDGTGHAYDGTYGTRVVLAAGNVVTNQPAPAFNGGYTAIPKIMTSSTNSALALSGAMSVELWVDVPSTLPSYAQYVFGQSYATSSVSAPATIELNAAGNPTFTLGVHTSGGDVTATAAAVLGAKNHVVLTWTGTALTAYVNGVASAGGTGSGPLANFASPYAGFTVGGAGGQNGYGGAVGQVAIYPTALSASQVQAHYNAGTGATTETIVWQTGNATLGPNSVPLGGGQCASPAPAISGNNVTFTVLRNTDGNYKYHTYDGPGSSTCYRNMMNPNDPNTGTNYLLALGTHWKFKFQTVVTLNGNTAYRDDLANDHFAADIPAIVWQTHSLNGATPPPDDKGGPCDELVIQNTYVAWVNGSTLYGSQSPGGLATWNFHTCDDPEFGGNAYNSPDTLYDGEVDTWQIDIVAQIQGQSGGSVVVRRNGNVVYNAPSHVCDDSNPQCFWNFGAYVFYWENSEEPPGWNSNGVSITFNNMRLIKF